MPFPTPPSTTRSFPNVPTTRCCAANPSVRTFRIVFGPPQVYNVSLGLDRNDQPFLTIRIGIRTTFLSHDFQPWLLESFSFMGLAMIISIIVAAFVANLALQPIEQISHRLDTLAAQEALADASPSREAAPDRRTGVDRPAAAGSRT